MIKQEQREKGTNLDTYQKYGWQKLPNPTFS